MDRTPDAPNGSGASTASVVVRPPLLFLAALLLGALLDRFLPLAFPVSVIDPFHWVLGGSLIAGGLALFAAGIRNFGQAGTPVPTNQPTIGLVTTGVHGWTRNPIYLGMFLMYAGIGASVRGLWILILLLPLAAVIRYGVVAREEAYLERRFGDPYRSYKAQVHRWCGRTGRGQDTDTPA